MSRIIVPVGNFQIRTASGCTGALKPPDFVAARCKALAGVHATVKYLPPWVSLGAGWIALYCACARVHPIYAAEGVADLSSAVASCAMPWRRSTMLGVRDLGLEAKDGEWEFGIRNGNQLRRPSQHIQQWLVSKVLGVG